MSCAYLEEIGVGVSIFLKEIGARWRLPWKVGCGVLLNLKTLGPSCAYKDMMGRAGVRLLEETGTDCASICGRL